MSRSESSTAAGGPLRVLLVDPGGEMGGAEALVDALAHEVDPNRAVPIVACLGAGSWPVRLRADGIEVHVLERGRLRNLWQVAKVVVGLTRIVRGSGVDVVHANGNSALLYASLAARLAHARLIWHLHDEQSGAGASRRLLVRILRWCRPMHLIFSSPAASRGWLLLWGQPYPPNSIIVPDVDVSGIDEGRGDRARAELGIPDDAPVVVMLARPEPHKGHEDLVRATLMVHERIPDARVVMTTGWAGATEFRARLQALAQDLGVAEVVCLPAEVGPGLRADLLAACAVLAHPSWIEPFGLAMLEAMTAGKPVVAVATDGARYLVEPGVTGLLVPPRNPSELAAAIVELLGDPARAAAMGEAGRNRAAAISDGRMVEGIQAVWEAAQ